MSRAALLRAFRWCAWGWLVAALTVLTAVTMAGNRDPAWVLCLIPWAVCEAFIIYLREFR